MVAGDFSRRLVEWPFRNVEFLIIDNVPFRTS